MAKPKTYSSTEYDAIEAYSLAQVFMDRLYKMRHDSRHLLSVMLTDNADAEPITSRSKAMTMLRDAVNHVANTE
jgi:hypothetical protein